MNNLDNRINRQSSRQLLADCPKCCARAQLIKVGDEGGERRYWSVQCTECYYEAAAADEAKVNMWDAVSLWNERVNKE